MKALSRNEFDSLTETERELTQILGFDIKPGKKARKGRIKCTSGKPYILATTISCRLCGHSYTKIYQMLKQGSSLHSEEIPEIPLQNNMKIRKSSYTVRHCPNCHNYLEDFTKEDLIQKFLSYIYDGKNFLT